MTSTLPGSSNFLKPVRQSKADVSAQQAKVAERRRLRAEQQAQLRSLENKRDQWRAASARYYERHPEMKEKKRLKMAEKWCVASTRGQTQAHTLMLRAAKKLARRRWDPPPAAECRRLEQKLGDFSEVLDLNLSPDGDRFLPTHDDVLEMFIESIYEPLQHCTTLSETAAAKSLLILHRQTDLSPATKITRGAGDIWPDYDSRRVLNQDPHFSSSEEGEV
ncbi:hypothetical protein B0H14DRAFT_2621974 [Mycena olivaceomarginata]|nr:hypothetical protein B0H14DRAFT_2621974 [Mycena olivaceomarginata]